VLKWVGSGVFFYLFGVCVRACLCVSVSVWSVCVKLENISIPERVILLVVTLFGYESLSDVNIIYSERRINPFVPSTFHFPQVS